MELHVTQFTLFSTTKFLPLLEQILFFVPCSETPPVMSAVGWSKMIREND